MTHGEAFYQRKKNLDLTKGFEKAVKVFDTIKPRMSRGKALRYYGEKLRKVFGTDEVSPRDFIKLDDFFDYHDAMRISKKRKINV